MTDARAILKEWAEGLDGVPAGPWEVEYGEFGKGPDVRAYALLRRTEDESYTGIETVEVHCITGSPIMEHIARCSPERIAAVLAHVDALERALVQANADRERLDWLEGGNLRTNERYGTVYGWQYDINHNRASLTDHNLPALTVREAIDSARFPEKASEIKYQSAKERARLKSFDERFPGVRDRARKPMGDR